MISSMATRSGRWRSCQRLAFWGAWIWFHGLLRPWFWLRTSLHARRLARLKRRLAELQRRAAKQGFRHGLN